ncbi:porin [Paraburkholderia sacchari]|uniref:porin n=1 Tax=Paraburkholderia sacchari TaxID=159450 RepID=UPI001BD09255|nr:porin [Paraburkholderia sacchari]
MKKSLAIAAAVAATFASASYAQSSVTLYGIIDAGFTYTTNVNDNANYALASGNIQASRWGLRGVEDLGGGLKTIFTLESGFDVTNGKQSGGLFNRQSYVGLTHDQYGTLTLGRQFDSMIDYIGPMTAVGTWGGTYMAHLLDNDDLNGTFSLNNTIKYTSPNLSGFQFGGLYSFSNQASFAVNRAYSAGMSYVYQGLRLGAAYTQINGVNANGSGSVQGSPLVNTFGAVGANNRQRNWGAGASYAYGPMVGGVVFTQSRLNDSFGQSVRFNNVEANLRYNLTPALGIGAMYAYTNLNGAASMIATDGSTSAHWHQFALQADYALSKRTDVYLEGVGVWGAAGTSGFGITQIGYQGANNFSSTDDQGIVSVGIRHRF